MTTISTETLSDRELLEATVRAARGERCATAELLTLLAEVDARRLYLGEGCSSLFAFCTRVLHLSEHAAYHRIEVARAARRFPIVLELVARGDVTLTTVAMLRPHLTQDNHEALLSAARHKTKREVEHQIACLAPKPDAQTMIRRVPEPSPALVGNVEASPSAAPTLAMTAMGTAVDLPAAEVRVSSSVSATHIPRPTVAPLASDRYLLRVTLSAEAHAKLRRAQDLMRHTIPNGDAAAILERALSLLVDHLEKSKIARAIRPRATRPARRRNRHIPAHLKRAVWVRDGGRCAFVGAQGRCGETGRLEFHHLIPYARGGATDVANISLLCRAHNSFEGEAVFGPWVGRDSATATRSGPS